MSLFQSNLRKQIRKLPNILKSVKLIHYDSFVSSPRWRTFVDGAMTELLAAENMTYGNYVAQGDAFTNQLSESEKARLAAASQQVTEEEV